MTQDDKINVAILIIILVFAVVAFPAKYRESNDAELGRIVRQTIGE